MTETTTNLFVYGTLMPGEPNYGQIENFVIDHKPGTIEGILVDLGAYPALVPGQGLVKGVMLWLHEAALEITDRIEGYHPDRDGCLYFRKKVMFRASNDGQEIEARTYFFANPDSVADCPRLVVGELNGVLIHEWPFPVTGIRKQKTQRILCPIELSNADNNSR